MERTSHSLLAAVVLLSAAPLLAQDAQVQTGVFPAGEVFAPAESRGTRQVSRYLVRTVASDGVRAELEIPSTGRGRLLVWTLTAEARDRAAAAPGGASLRTPSGRALRGQEALSADAGLRRLAIEPAELGLDVAGRHDVVEVRAAEAGRHRVEVEAGDGAVTVVAAEPDSPLALSTWASPLSLLPGQVLTLHAELRDGDAPVRGAHVSVRLAAPGGLGGRSRRLRDDGRQGDTRAGDGVYTLRLAALPSPKAGFWTARFEAAGRDARGAEFARSGSSGFVAERRVARLLGSGLRAGRGGDGVAVEAAVAVEAPGLYRLDAILAGPRQADGSRPALAWGELHQRLAPGKARLRLTVPMGAQDGEPELVELRLLAVDAMSVAGRTVVPVE